MQELQAFFLLNYTSWSILKLQTVPLMNWLSMWHITSILVNTYKNSPVSGNLSNLPLTLRQLG